MVTIAGRRSAASPSETVATTTPHCRGGRSRTVQAASSRAQCVHLHLGHTLQPGDALQLQIQRIHDNPGKDIRHIEHHPDEEHEDVVGGGAAGHVVDDGSIDPRHDLPRCEKPHRPKPGFEAPLFLQPQRVKDDAGRNEEGDGANNGSESREEEEVANVMVANVDKVKAEQVVASVAAARFGLLKQVAVKERGDPRPGGECECVEGDVPGGRGEVCVEGTGNQGPTPPRHSGRFQADAARMCSQGPR